MLLLLSPPLGPCGALETASATGTTASQGASGPNQGSPKGRGSHMMESLGSNVRRPIGFLVLCAPDGGITAFFNLKKCAQYVRRTWGHHPIYPAHPFNQEGKHQMPFFEIRTFYLKLSLFSVQKRPSGAPSTPNGPSGSGERLGTPPCAHWCP